MKDGGLNFWVETNWQNVSIIWSPLLYFNLKSSLDPNTSSFIRFQSFVHESGTLFLGSRNFFKLKRGVLISKGNQFWRKSELFGLPFCISVLEVLWTHILRHSLDLSDFCMTQEHFS